MVARLSSDRSFATGKANSIKAPAIAEPLVVELGKATTNAPALGARSKVKHERPSDERRYQGIPFRSGTLAVDGSGCSPDMRISARRKTPALPPTMNATINHQAETIVSPPFPWSRYVAGRRMHVSRLAPTRKKSPACAGPVPHSSRNLASCRRGCGIRVASNNLNSTAPMSVGTNPQGEGSMLPDRARRSTPPTVSFPEASGAPINRRCFVKL